MLEVFVFIIKIIPCIWPIKRAESGAEGDDRSGRKSDASNEHRNATWQRQVERQQQQREQKRSRKKCAIK